MERLNLLGPEVRKNPYPFYAELRRAAPVTQVEPGGLWAVSRYQDVAALLKDPARFSSAGLRATTQQPWLDHNPMTDALILMDPPQHSKVRALVSHAFGARVVPRIEAPAREAVRRFVAGIREGGVVEVCRAFSSALPATVLGELLGIDSAHYERIRDWSDAIMSVNPGTPKDAQPRIRAAIAEFERYSLDVIGDRRRCRRNDLVSDLLVAEVDGQRMGDAELVSFFLLLVVAGYETTTHLLTHALCMLAKHPELIARLRAEPAVIPAFVDEVLRYEPVAHGTLRLALADSVVGGVKIPAGSPVMLLLGSACRDEQYAENPDRFDIDRRQHGSISFGHGVHFCLGAALARAEARIALEELLPHVRGIRLAGEPTWNLSLTVRGPLACTMEFER